MCNPNRKKDDNTFDTSTQHLIAIYVYLLGTLKAEYRYVVRIDVTR